MKSKSIKKENVIVAELRYLRQAPRKVRLQADVIRGMSVTEAQAQLMLSPRRSSDPILKLLKSAIANAKYKKIDPHTLIVKEIRVDQGPKQKRWIPRARGAWSSIIKWTSHVTIVLGVSDTLQKSAIVIYEKPKKKIKDEKKKVQKQKADDREKIKKDTSKEKEESVKKHSGEVGSLKRVFRRKAI